MRNCKVHTENPFEDNDTKFGREELNLFKGLSKTGLKILLYIVENCTRVNDKILFDIEKAKFEIGFRENKSVYKGLTELITKDVLAGCSDSNEFYYNTTFINKEKTKLDGCL